MLKLGIILGLILCSIAVEKNYTDFVKDLQVKINRPQYKHSAWKRLAYLTDTYGPRMWGSQVLEMSIQWLKKQAELQGFENVHLQRVANFTKWVRGKQELTLLSPRPWPTKLDVIGLGNTVAKQVTAEVLVVESFADLDANKEKANGRIVCYNSKWTNYDESNAYRVDGASYAAQYGAVATLLRSVTSQSIYSVHTGYMQYNLSLSQNMIPCAAITVEDSEMFARMQARGDIIKVHLVLQNQFVPHSNSNNLVFQIKGSKWPEQIVVAGGHIDTWDTGSQTGANDDGGGFISVFESLRLLLKNGYRPQRTLRFVAWSGQQAGKSAVVKDGAYQYVQTHLDQMHLHVAAFESDYGSTKFIGIGHEGNLESQAITKFILANYLSILKADKLSNEVFTADIYGMEKYGVPLFANFIQDTPDHHFYFKYHHTAGDSMSMMDPDDLDSNVVGIATFLYIIADLNQTVRNVTTNVATNNQYYNLRSNLNNHKYKHI